MAKHGDGRARIPSTPRVEVEVAELPSGLKFVGSKQMLKIHRNEKDGSTGLHPEAGDRFSGGVRVCDPDHQILQTFRTVACQVILST